MRDIKRYDSKLVIKKNINGSIDIIRNSSLEKKKEYVVMTITNQYLGDWIIDKLKSMDSHRIDFIDKTLKNNLAIRNKRSDNRQSKDIAEFIRTGEQIII